MTVFKTYFKVVKKYRGMLFLYIAILVLFAGFNMKSEDNKMDFSNTKANVHIINEDKNEEYTKNLIDYISNRNNVIDIDEDKDTLKDALFYRKIHLLITIPKGYNESLKEGKPKEIVIESTKNYNASLIEMELKRYLKVQDIYLNQSLPIDETIEKINSSLKEETEIEKTSKLDKTVVEREAFFFNFTTYCILATVIFVICIVLSSFHQDSVNKRTIISSMNYRKHNRIILLASSLFALSIGLLFCLLSIIFVGTTLISLRGLLYMINLLVFTFVALTMALLLSNIVNNKDAIGGIVNVIALGSSFLCGAFVPTSMLPNGVLKLAHILPAYWFINSNEIIKNLEIINFKNIIPILENTIILFVFALVYIITNNVISKRKQKK